MTTENDEPDVSFEDIFNASMGDIHEPHIFPQGTWALKITSGKLVKGTIQGGPLGQANFSLIPVEPKDDVAPAELEAVGDWRELRGFHRIPLFNRADKWNVVTFLKKLGIEYAPADTLGAKVAEAKGYVFNAYVEHGVNKKDPERPFVNFKNVQAAA